MSATANDIEVDFKDTQFFHSNKIGIQPRCLPSPFEVLKGSTALRRGVSVFKELDLLVKYGPSALVKVDEALTLRYVNQSFPKTAIHSPEVYGYKIYNGGTFIYMELIRGQTLWSAWPSLLHTEREYICQQLSSIISALRLNQQEKAAFVGKLNRLQNLQRNAYADRICMSWSCPG